MTTDTRTVALVSFGKNSDTILLRGELDELGYDVEHLEGTHWLSHGANTHNGPMVLLLGHGHEFKNEIRPSLSSLARIRVLGVFTEDHDSWDEDFIDYFDDFIGWPCHEHELSLRMSKLCSAESSDDRAPVENPNESALVREFLAMDIVGQSPAFIKVLRLIKRFACCDAPVFVEGETGTGKELVSRAIHEKSVRRHRPFIAVNCGAIPDSLVENDLFGHERGAFTDAKKDQTGLVAQANGGTLFLDEVDTLSPKGQVCLLRFLEDQEYRPLGSMCAKKTDVRVVSASNTCLSELCRRRLFRRDLMYRLMVLSLKLPPLRERDGDIPLLTSHFIRRFGKNHGIAGMQLSLSSQKWLDSQTWEGNIRELENLLQREMLLADGPEICLTAGGDEDARPGKSNLRSRDRWAGVTFQEAKSTTVRLFERRYLEWLMAETAGNISAAAKRSGKQRSAIRKLLQKHRIDKNAWVSKAKDVTHGDAAPDSVPAGSGLN